MSVAHTESISVSNMEKRHAFVHVHEETIKGKLRKVWAKRPWGPKIYEPKICWTPVSERKQYSLYKQATGIQHSWRHNRTYAKEFSSYPAMDAYVLTACNCGVDVNNGFLIHTESLRENRKEDAPRPMVFNAVKVELLAYEGRDPMIRELNNWEDREISMDGPLKPEFLKFGWGTESIAQFPTNKKINSLLRTFRKAEEVYLIIEMRRTNNIRTWNNFDVGRLRHLLLSNKRVRAFARIERPGVAEMKPQRDYTVENRAPLPIFLSGVVDYVGVDPEDPPYTKVFNLQQEHPHSKQHLAAEDSSSGKPTPTPSADKN